MSMVPDDPFHDPPKPPERSTASPSPILRVHSAASVRGSGSLPPSRDDPSLHSLLGQGQGQHVHIHPPHTYPPHHPSHAAHGEHTPPGTGSAGGAGEHTPPGTRSAGPSTIPAVSVSAPVSATDYRAPRRVQWTADRVVNMAPAGEPSVERHEVHEGDLPDNEVHPANLSHVNDALERFKRTRHGAPSTLSMGSAASAATTASSDDGEDYDYRLDKDPMPSDPDDRERFEMRLLGRHHRRHRERNNDEDGEHGNGDGDDEHGNHHEYEDERLASLLDNGAREQVQGGYVQLGETDGLPSLPDSKSQELARATSLVRSHTGKWGALRRRVRSGSVVKKAKARDAEHGEKLHKHESNTGYESSGSSRPLNASRGDNYDDDDKGKGKDKEESTPLNPRLNPPPGMTGGTSVLSSLLTLYNQQHQQEGNSGATSAATSAANTPQSSRPPSPDEDSTPPTPRHRFWHKKGVAPPPNSGTGATASGTGSGEHSPHREPSGVFGHFQRAIEEFRDDRPKAARSGAGVFGALIQNTGGMVAAAAPQASTLVPAAKRPGYHLSRFSLSEPDTPVSPRRPGPMGFGGLSRPSSGVGIDTWAGKSGSRSGSRPSSAVNLPTLNYGAGEFGGQTQQHAHSRQGSLDPVSPQTTVVEGSSPDHGDGNGAPPASKLSDNLLMMGKERKRPSALNLRAVKSAEKWITNKEHDWTHVANEQDREAREEEKRRREAKRRKAQAKKAKEQRKKQEVFIIQHVAAIIARQQFLLKLARALMMFGSPSHRLETQIQATAKVLDINAQVVYIPGVMLVSFGDDTTHTSDTKFLKQSTALDLGKLLGTHNVYWEVVHDRISVEDANRLLDNLMTMPKCYNWWQMIIIGGLCSAFILIPSYYGSLIDALMAIPLGMLLVVVQIFAARNDLFSAVFEITSACLISFLAAALASSGLFCYTALVSGGVVLILPGFIVLTGSLELASRNITAGAVRIGYSVIYALFLGFGISIGAEVWVKVRGQDVVNAVDATCSATHYEGAPWYMQRPEPWWYFLCVPSFALMLSLNNQQPLFAKELPIMVILACAGWVTNFYSSKVFVDRSDIISAIGSFVIGILGNLYGRFLSRPRGASFPVMVTGIMMQLPSGLKAGGLFSFANAGKEGTTQQYSTGFQVAQQLISVAIGLTVGLFVAAVITHPLGGSRRRGAGIFSF